MTAKLAFHPKLRKGSATEAPAVAKFYMEVIARKKGGVYSAVIHEYNFETIERCHDQLEVFKAQPKRWSYTYSILCDGELVETEKTGKGRV